MLEKEPSEEQDVSNNALHFDVGDWAQSWGDVRASSDVKQMQVRPVDGVLELPASMAALGKTTFEQMRASLRIAESNGSEDEVYAVLKQLVQAGFSNPMYMGDAVAYADLCYKRGLYEEAFECYKSVLQKKRDHPKAIEGLERFIEHDAFEQEAYKILEPVYTVLHDYSKLVSLLECRFKHVDQLDQRKVLARRIGDLYESKLKQQDKVFDVACQIFLEDPKDLGVRTWLEKSACTVELLHRLAQVYEKYAENCSLEDSVVFLKRSAQCYEEKIQDMVSSERVLEKIVGLDEKDEKAFLMLRDLYKRTEQYEKYIGLLQKRMPLITHEEKRKEYDLECAHIWLNVLKNNEEAKNSYEKIVQTYVDAEDAHGVLQQLYVSLEQWGSLEKYFDDRVAYLNQKMGEKFFVQKQKILFEKAKVLANHLMREEESSELIVREKLLEGFLKDVVESYVEEKASLGSRAFMCLSVDDALKKGVYEKAIQRLESLYLDEDVQEKRMAYAMRAGEVCEQLHMSSEVVFQWFLRVLSEDVQHEKAYQKLLDTASSYGLWDTWVEEVSSLAETVLDKNTQKRMFLDLSEKLFTEVKNPVLSSSFAQKALACEPENTDLLDTAFKRAEQALLWDVCIEMLDRMVHVYAEPHQKSACLEKMAHVYEHVLKKPSEALKCHGRILEIDKHHPVTLRAMEALYLETHDHALLLQNIQEQLLLCDSKEEQVRLYSLLGRVEAEEKHDYESSIKAWEQVLACDPSHQEAQKTLELLYMSEGKDVDLIRFYEEKSHQNISEEERIRVDISLSELYRKDPKNLEKAYVCLTRVLGKNAHHKEVLKSLIDVCCEMQNPVEMGLFQDRLLGLSDEKESFEIRLSIVKNRDFAEKHQDISCRVASELMLLDSEDPQVWHALIEFFLNIKDMSKLSLCLDRFCSFEKNTLLSGSVCWFVFEQTYQMPCDSEYTKMFLKKNISCQSNHGKAFDVLLGILWDEKQWEEWVEYAERYVSIEGAKDVTHVLDKIRHVREEFLCDNEMAFLSSCKAYQSNPSSLDSLNAFMRLAEKTGFYEECLGVCEEELDKISDKDIFYETLKKMAFMYENALQNNEKALETWEKIQSIGVEQDVCFENRVRISEKMGDFLNQVYVYQQWCLYTEDQKSKKNHYQKMAEVFHVKLSDEASAYECLLKAHACDPTDECVIDSLIDLCESSLRWNDVVMLLEKKIALVQDEKNTYHFCMKLGYIYEEEIKQDQKSLEWYEKAFHLQKDSTLAFESLERMYTSRDQWHKLMSLYESYADFCNSQELRIAICMRSFSLYEVEFKNEEKAIDVLYDVLKQDEKNIIALTHLYRLLKSKERWDEWIKTADILLSLSHEDEEKVLECCVQVADVLLHVLSKHRQAMAYYEKALSIAPENTYVLMGLVEVSSFLELYEQAISYCKKAMQGMDDASLAKMWCRVGGLYVSSGARGDEAQASYEKALVYNPRCYEAVSFLRQNASSKDQSDVYVRYLVDEAELCENTVERKKLFQSLAEVFLKENKIEEVEAYHKRILSLDPTDDVSLSFLGKLYVERHQWKACVDLYVDILKDHKSFLNTEAFSVWCCYAADSYAALGDHENAGIWYEKSYALDPTSLDTSEKYGQFLFSIQKYSGCIKIFESMLVHHHQHFSLSERAEVYAFLGDAHRHENHFEEAVVFLEKAVLDDPSHVKAWRVLVDCCLNQNMYEKAYEAMGSLAVLCVGEEALEWYMRMCALALEHIHSPSLAIKALESLRPFASADHVESMHTLASLYVQEGLFVKALDVYELMVSQIPENEEKARILTHMGEMCESMPGYEGRAFQCYERALKEDPLALKAVEYVQGVLCAHKRWKDLEEHYVDMIARTSSAPLVVRTALWKDLAELYRCVLNAPEEACVAYEVLCGLDSENADNIRIFSELCRVCEGKKHRAYEVREKLLEKEEHLEASLRVLKTWYYEDKNFDAVYVLCDVLNVLGFANEEEKQTWVYLQKGVPSQVNKPFTHEIISDLLVDVVEHPVGSFFAHLYPLCGGLFLKDFKDAGLKKKDKVDMASEKTLFAGAARYVMSVLGVQEVVCYKKPSSTESLQVLPVYPPALSVGAQNAWCTCTSVKKLSFVLGKHMSSMRPEWMLGSHFSASYLRSVLKGLVAVYQADDAVQGEVRMWKDFFETIPLEALKSLHPYARAAYEEEVSSQGKAIESYVKACEKGSSRVGLLCALDVASALYGLSQENSVSGATREQLMKDMVLFAVSPLYLRMREKTGSALVVGKEDEK
jgi:tetratricopeptide (TPR) repeat protein